MPTAVNRPGYNGGGTDALAEWFTQQRMRNPNFQAPPGYEWKGDHYERDTHGLGQDIGKWTAIGGATAAGSLGGLGLAGIGPAAAGAGATSTGAVGLPAGLAPEMIAPGLTTSLSPGTLASLGGAGAAGSAGAAGAGATGGTLSTIRSLAPLLGMGVSALGALRGGGAQDVPFEDELSGILNIQRSRMEQANPLYQAILKMAMGLLPMSARSGLMPPSGGNPRG